MFGGLRQSAVLSTTGQKKNIEYITYIKEIMSDALRRLIQEDVGFF